ncbi:Mu-like prophage major head subunit gpT family protein [Roseibium porphyridii]|uniref:Mu-like prophage major head subunit gpT family protein n=1 Tax=Roseibium porphyridii TaxID=2866279 RepID=A0ABY8FC05_9HYPH|nr:Mu-like prophage major head subunit gpT family protein [Roseibium sp. KMA01]WFE92299.1 Mu-like prophage major head subunit gpT family protein [Roseibium sp. KMA01]
MDINAQALQSAYVGFNAAFQSGLKEGTSLASRIATTVPSTTRENEYGWLGKFPRFREWIGDRVINSLAKHGYAIKNKPFELTVEVDRDDFDDDNLGIYNPLFRDLGMSSMTFPDELVWPLLKNGFTEKCYDGQNFFDTDHPVLDENGNEISVANTDGGVGTPWFLMDVSRPLKPIIFQDRKRPNRLIRMDKEDDTNVFMKKQFVYGLDGRANVGFGFWQMVWGSKQTLNAANYETARIGLGSLKADFGEPLAINPNLLVVPPALEGAANEIVKSQLVNGGESNKWAGTAEVLVVNWLA